MTFVGYRITIPYLGKRPFGHSGITISNDGSTRYYEFGRYNPTRVRYRGPFPDFKLGSNGVPTEESLKNYLAAVTKVAGQNKPVEGAYFINDQAAAMLDFAKARVADPSKQGNYSILGNNCATFCEDVLEAGGEELDISLVNSPDNVIQELQDVADFILYFDPESDDFLLTCNVSTCPE